VLSTGLSEFVDAVFAIAMLCSPLEGNIRPGLKARKESLFEDSYPLRRKWRHFKFLSIHDSERVQNICKRKQGEKLLLQTNAEGNNRSRTLLINLVDTAYADTTSNNQRERLATLYFMICT